MDMIMNKDRRSQPNQIGFRSKSKIQPGPFPVPTHLIQVGFGAREQDSGRNGVTQGHWPTHPTSCPLPELLQDDKQSNMVVGK